MGYTINYGGKMKIKLGLLALTAMFANDAYSATCTSINYTSSSANSVLTSSKYNTDHSTTYNAINSFDGGCIAANSIDDQDSFDTTEFSVWRDTPITGCRVSISDSNTLSVDRCRIMVNGNNLKTTGATTVTWGCSGCDSETTSQTYYLYVKNSATFTLHIDDTAPNADGYDASNNRVIAKFWNNSSSDIVAVGNRIGNNYEPYDEVLVHTGNGHGSTDNKIRIFTTAQIITGAAITRATTAGNGDTFTINEDGIYSISYIDGNSAALAVIGVSLNSAQLTTSVRSITAANKIIETGTASADVSGLSVTLKLKAADVIRAHTDGTPNNASNAARFRIVKIANSEVN